VLAAFLDRLQNKRLPPVAFVTSRGRDNGPPPAELRDGVVAADSSKLDLSRVMSVAASELHFYLEPLDAPAGCGALLFKMPAGTRAVPVAEFHPRCNGLYQLSATDAAMQGSYPATVLFVAPVEEARAARMLDDAVRVTAQWQSAGEEEKRTFLRLTLGAIQQTLRSGK
jgi:hypothetical protein